MTRAAATNRRDFLRGHGLRQAVSEHVGIAAAPPLAPEQSAAWIVTVERRAMACRFQVLLPAAMVDAPAAGAAALDEINRLEAQLTVYCDDSELSRVNQAAGVIPVAIEGRLFALLEEALRLSVETGGAFDIAVGALVKAWGFFRGPKRVPGRAELAAVMERVGSRHVVLDPLARTVHFRRPGLELNLGAIGKGYALDRAAELLRREWRMPSGILHGGRSSVLAIGSPPAETAGTGWLVALQHPFDASRQVARLRLRDLALGTSGATVQYFEADGRRFGHILDPRSGWPAAGQVCVSVVAATAAQADALSTAFFISGPDQARAYCARHPEVGAVLVALPRPGAELELTVLGAAQGLVEALVSESEA